MSIDYLNDSACAPASSPPPPRVSPPPVRPGSIVYLLSTCFRGNTRSHIFSTKEEAQSYLVQRMADEIDSCFITAGGPSTWTDIKALRHEEYFDELPYISLKEEARQNWKIVIYLLKAYDKTTSVFQRQDDFRIRPMLVHH